MLCAAQFMVIVDTTIVNVALPGIQRDLHLSGAGLTWIVNAYVLTFAGFLLLGGRVADLWERRRMYLLGLAVFTVMSLFGGLAQSGGELIAARALQGLGSAALVPAIMSILITTYTEDKARHRALGIWASVAGAGGATGVLAGGVLTDLLSWRWIFFVNVPIGVILLVVARLVMPRAEPAAPGTAARRQSLDWGGAVTVTAGLAALVFGIVETSDHSWGSALVVASLVVGAVLLAAFVGIESRHPRPLVPLRLFRSRSLSGADAMMFLVAPSIITSLFFLSEYLQDVHGYSPLRTGFAFVVMPLGFVSGSQISSRLVGRLGVRALLIAGLIIAAVALFWLSRLQAGDGYALHFAIPAYLTMLGISMAYVPITLSANGGVDPGDAGLASGVLNTTQQVGGSVGLAVMVSIAAARTSSLHSASTGAALTAGYARAFAVCAILAVAAIVIAVVVMPRHRVSQREVRSLQEEPVLGEAIAQEPQSAVLLELDAPDGARAQDR